MYCLYASENNNYVSTLTFRYLETITMENMPRQNVTRASAGSIQ